MPDHVVLDPADFGRDGIMLTHLLGIAVSSPQEVLERGKIFGRGGGKEPVTAWQLRAVQQVLADNGINVHQAATGPMVKGSEAGQPA